jgi:ankyrin repeat protein
VLHCAVANGHAAVVDVLLGAGAKVNVGGESKRTPLFLAGERGDLAVARLLLSHGAKLNMQDNYGTPHGINACLLAVLLAVNSAWQRN